MTAPQSVACRPARYDFTAMAFHWVSFLLIVFIASLGLLFDSMTKASQPYWINIHAVAGLFLLALAVARIAWRMTHRPPELPANIDVLSRKLSTPVHHTLYLLSLLIPVAGIVAFVWHARAFNFGLFAIDFGVKSAPAIFHLAEDVHSLLAYGLLALAGLHGLLALWHQYVKRDGILARMLPWG